MDTATITKQVKQIIGSITGIQVETIADSATYVGDLGLDSLAILEIAVDVEKAFGFRAQDEELQKIRSVQDSVNLILQHSCQQVAWYTAHEATHALIDGIRVYSTEPTSPDTPASPEIMTCLIEIGTF